MFRTKKLKFLLFVSLLFLCGCAGSALMTSYNAEENRANMINLKKGMTQTDVMSIMGRPYKTIKKATDANQYEIWYYVTKGVYIDQTKYIDENFTPFIFFEGYLKGWGDTYYNWVFNINGARQKKAEALEREEKYKELWPEDSCQTPDKNPTDQKLQELLNDSQKKQEDVQKSVVPQKQQEKNAQEKDKSEDKKEDCNWRE